MGAQEPQYDVALPEHVVERVRTRLDRTDFDSVEAYVTFVLEETLARVEAGAETDADAPDLDEAEVRTRLESLGYLDE